MSEYGLTPNGPNIKRLDAILDNMHTGLSKRWGVNTRQNPESFVNHMLTNIADAIAELWEFGEDVYYSEYPSFAEGRSLDNAAQFGGSTRETAAKSYYPIHCTGRDGTTLAAGTMISTTTNPTTQLSLTASRQITRAAFNKAVIKIASLGANDVYTVALNGAVFSYASKAADATEILKGLVAAIKDEDFTVSLDEENELLKIEAADITSTNVLVLSENLTTDTVTTIIQFGTVETGDILVEKSPMQGIVLTAEDVPSMIDELPLVALLCAYADGESRISGAGELRVKESDRIRTVCELIAALGGICIETEDGFIIRGKKSLPGGDVDSYLDHRIAMTAAVGLTASEKGGNIRGAGCCAISFPGFFRMLEGAEKGAGEGA